MRRACIAIVDATRARIYTYEGDSDGASDRALREEIDLVNPGRRGHDQFSTTKPGVKRMASGGGSTDDHRDAHLDQLERNFARHIIDEVDRIARQRGLGRVILVTTPKMLGELRKVDAVLEHADLEVSYVERDLAQLTSPQIHDHLAELHLISPRHRAALASR